MHQRIFKTVLVNQPSGQQSFWSTIWLTIILVKVYLHPIKQSVAAKLLFTQPPHTQAGGHTSELDKKLTKEKRNHTNTHKQTTKAAHPCMFNARVHYTVLTQHPNHTRPTQTVSARHMVRHKKRGIMPQTPNNAPTYKQQLLF